MSELTEELAAAVRKMETEGTPADLSEAGAIVRGFLRRNSLLTLGHEGQQDALLAAMQTSDWPTVEKLRESSFEDVSKTARIFIYSRDHHELYTVAAPWRRP